MKQEPPFAIQIEPTEGCTLACSFCGLQSIRDNGADAQLEMHGNGKGPYKFMNPELAHLIARSIKHAGWNPRIEFAMHGEPTVNPQLPLIIEHFRSMLPKVSMMLTTNGSGLLKQDRIDAIFEAGINTIAFDAYEHAPWKDRAEKALLEYAGDISYYPKDKTANPHQRYHGRRIVVIADISSNDTGTHQLTNQGSNSFPSLDDPLQKRCAKPFRELSIRWDGNVALCCDDWKGEYKIGNVKDMTLEELWNHPRFNAARMALYAGERGRIGVCSGCNVTTYRNGLLPDKMGKDTMPHLRDEHLKLIKQAQQGKVFSIKEVK